MQLSNIEAVRYMTRQLERHGLYVEESPNSTEGKGLSISLTQFGLSTVYATVGPEEVAYFIDTLNDEDVADIRAELRAA